MRERDERQQQERTARDNSKRLETTEKTTVRYEKNEKVSGGNGSSDGVSNGSSNAIIDSGSNGIG